MCFSATANFVGGGVLGGLGAISLAKVKHRRELLFASIPMLFAAHQLIEGFVWLGLDGTLSPQATHYLSEAYMLYAQGLLPFLLPLSVLLFEPDGLSRRRMLPFLLLGTMISIYALWALAAYPLQTYIRENSIAYINQGTNKTIIASLYIATCGSLFFSRVKAMVIFGAVNLAILLLVTAVKRYAFTSMWCAYAAISSLIILVYLWNSSADRPFHYRQVLEEQDY
jgi:hypothetical protein